MGLKVYRARSMKDALAEVKKDLGEDAVILHTRNYRTGGLLGLGARSIVEITATADENPPTRRAAPVRSLRAAPASASTAQDNTEAATVAPAAATIAAEDPLAGLFAESTGGAEQSARAVPIESVLAPRRRVIEPAVRDARMMPVARSKASPPAPTDDIQTIKRMVSRLLQSATPHHAGAMSDPLFEHYLRLQENAVAAEIADDVIGRVRDELSASELADEEIVRETLLRHIAGLIPVADEPIKRQRPADGRPRTVSLIGPTGVGKTTTLAKLAATAKLRHGRQVGLITTDTYRIAAVEQLRTYADIIGLRLTVVARPSEMRPALDAMADLDEVFIDTAGRSQHDAQRLAELRAYLDEADPHEIHLVLSSVASEAVLSRAVDNFAELGPNRLIVTKLDEAVNFGVLLGVVRRLGVNLSYVTTGQEVPDHIEPGKPDRLARLILTGSLPS
ncbi:MAG: flagellar biosynthesis protein FlhF [Planctomycetota bacterium]